MTQVLGASIVPGRQVYGNGALGVLGSLIPGSGSSGPAYAYPSLEHPADDAAEIQGLVTSHTFPPGTFFAYPDTSFTAIGAPDGTYSVTFDYKRDGVLIGAVTFPVYIGAAPGASASVSISTAGASFSGSSSSSTTDAHLPLQENTLSPRPRRFILASHMVTNPGFDPKDPRETILIGFQFSTLTATPAAPVVTVAHHAGAADATPASMLVGEPQISGSLVVQRITGGVDYADYLMSCQVDAPDGLRFVLAGVLPVRTA